MVRVATEDMRKLIIEQWRSEEIFGSSSIRLPTKQVKNTVGIAEGVPLDMNDDDLKNNLDMLFSDTTFVRMSKGPTKQRHRTPLRINQSESICPSRGPGMEAACQTLYKLLAFWALVNPM